MALLKCRCAFRLRRLAQNAVPGIGVRHFSCNFPYSYVCSFALSHVCLHALSHMCSYALSYVCSCVLLYVCSCVLSCVSSYVLSYVCSCACALMCVLLCARIRVLSSVLSYVCSHDTVSFSQFHPPHCLGSLAGIILVDLVLNHDQLRSTFDENSVQE